MRLAFMISVILFLGGCFLFAFIPLSGGNELKDAVADAMKKKPYADAIIEVMVDGYWQWWILFGRGCTQV
jgi:hypothetical protein